MLFCGKEAAGYMLGTNRCVHAYCLGGVGVGYCPFHWWELVRLTGIKDFKETESR